MPLELFAVLVPAGIAIIVLIVRFWGLSHDAILKDASHARKLFLIDFADQNPRGKGIISSDRRAAFLKLDMNKSIGLVEVIGDRFLTRVLYGEDIQSIKGEKFPNLKINYNDFTHPSGNYKFAADDDLKTVTQWINALKETK